MAQGSSAEGPDHGRYVSAVAHAVNELRRARLLLPEDGQRYIEEAAQSDIGRPDFSRRPAMTDMRT